MQGKLAIICRFTGLLCLGKGYLNLQLKVKKQKFQSMDVQTWLGMIILKMFLSEGIFALVWLCLCKAKTVNLNPQYVVAVLIMYIRKVIRRFENDFFT